MASDEELGRIVVELQITKTDFQEVEVKASVNKLPVSIVESVSSFTNASGGTVVLGLSEKEEFEPSKGFSAHRMLDALAGACADKLTPPVRAGIRIATFDGAAVLVADVPETAPSSKPCYITERGMYKSPFIRTRDGDRYLTQYACSVPTFLDS